MDMKCEGCVNAVKSKLQTVPGRLFGELFCVAYLAFSFCS